MEQLTNVELRKIRELLSQGYGYETAYQIMKLAMKREQDEKAAYQFTFEQRIKAAKQDVERFKQEHAVKDPWGNSFNSKNAMLEHYGFNWYRYGYLKRRGMTLEWILSHPDWTKAKKEATKINDERVLEKFRKQKEAEVLKRIEEYKRNNKSRKKRVYKSVKDHLGNKFASQADMCRVWGVDPMTFSRRVNKQGWSLERALLAPTYQTNKKNLKNC